MGARVDTASHGLILWDARFDASGLAPVGVGAGDSSYTQSGAVPPAPVSWGDGSLYATGALGAEAEVTALQGGPASTRPVAVDGLRYEPILWPRAYEVVRYLSGNRLSACAAHDTGYPVVVSAVEADGGTEFQVHTRTTGAGAWTTDTVVTDIDETYLGEVEGIGVAALPDRLVVLLYDGGTQNDGACSSSWQSLDGGATWECLVRGFAAPGVPKQCRRLTMASTGAGALVGILQADDVSGDCYQIASIDGGATWVLVATLTALGYYVSLFPLANGDVGLTYENQADGWPMFRRISLAQADIADTVPVQISDSRDTFNSLSGFASRGATVYLVGSDAGQLVTWTSDDYGTTWREIGTGLATRNTAIRPENMAGVYTPWGAVILHNSATVSPSSRDDSVQALWLGGWTDASWYSFLPLTTPRRMWGETAHGTLWLPWGAPGGGPWTLTGAGATLAEKLDLTGATYYTSTDTAFGTNAKIYLDFAVVSGGSLTSMDIGCKFGGTNYSFELRATATGFRLRDVHAGSNTFTATKSGRTQILVDVDPVAARVTVWYRSPHDTEWLTSGPQTYTTGASAHLMRWGNHAGAGSSSQWWSAGYDKDTTPQISLTKGLGDPLPLWLRSETYGAGATLRGAGGSVPIDTVATLTPDYRYPIGACLPPDALSPATQWRSTQAAAAEALVWPVSHRAESMALVVCGAAARRYTLGYYDGAAWQVLASLDLATGFTGLGYSLYGSQVRPNLAATASGARYIQAGELVGGWVEFASVACRITANTAGAWVQGAAASTVVPVITVDLDGAAPSATGTCNLVWPCGVVVAQPSSAVQGATWRVRALADTVPGAALGAGVVLVGSVTALGGSPDWGWSDDTLPAVARSWSPYGTPRQREVGPVYRRWSWGWGDPLLLESLRQSVDQAYLARPTGLPLVAAEDVWWQLRAALQTHQALPVVALRRIPADGVTITDPTLWLYGVLEGSVGARGLAGEEGIDETIRLETITVREIK